MQDQSPTITKPVALIGFLIASMVIGYSFSFFTEAVGGQMLDLLYTEEEARATLAVMTPAQKQAHIDMTFLLDILYPLSLCGLLYGLILKFAPSFLKWTTLLPVVALFVDYGENIVQVLALADIADFLAAKSFLTPAKYYAFLASGVAALLFMIKAAIALAIRKFNPKT